MRTLKLKNGEWELSIRLDGCMKVYRGKRASSVLKAYSKEVCHE